MSFKMSTALKNAMLGAIKTTLANGVIHIYSGSQPATSDAAPTGTLLGIVTLNAGAFSHGTATNGLEFDAASAATLNKAAAETWQFKGLAAGTAGWFRFIANAADSGALDSAETYPRMDGRISTSGAEMNMSNLSVAVDAISTIDSLSITWPSTF